MNNQAGYVILNGTLMPADRACIYPGQSAVYYGTGCFETLLAENLNMFRFKEHLQRLNTGLNYLGVPGHLHLRESEVREEIIFLLKKNGLEKTNARVRVQVSLDERKGYHQPDNSALIQFITAKKQPEPAEAVTLASVRTRVVPATCKPATFKSSNMLHYRNALREAEKKGADDALMLNTRNFVAETSIANVFWKSGDEIFTPSEECDLLPGITRSVLLEILDKKQNLSVHLGVFSLADIESADLAWVTNSVSGIMPVKSLNGKTFRMEDEFLYYLKKEFSEKKKEYFS